MLRNLRLSKPYFELKASEIASMPSPNFSGSDEVFTETSTDIPVSSFRPFALPHFFTVTLQIAIVYSIKCFVITSLTVSRIPVV